MTDVVLRFGTVQKTPGETYPVSLDLFDWCANYWSPNEQIAANEYIRPTASRSNGYAYQASGAGTTGAREPAWGAATVTDGSVTWTRVTAGANGLNAISSPSASSDPTGLTVASPSVSESTKILTSYSGGSDGQDFEVEFTFTLNGVSRTGRQKVEVRKA